MMKSTKQPIVPRSALKNRAKRTLHYEKIVPRKGLRDTKTYFGKDLLEAPIKRPAEKVFRNVMTRE